MAASQSKARTYLMGGWLEEPAYASRSLSTEGDGASIAAKWNRERGCYIYDYGVRHDIKNMLLRLCNLIPSQAKASVSLSHGTGRRFSRTPRESPKGGAPGGSRDTAPAAPPSVAFPCAGQTPICDNMRAPKRTSHVSCQLCTGRGGSCEHLAIDPHSGVGYERVV
jgi:hypothetical protein